MQRVWGKNPNLLDSNVLVICSGGRDGNVPACAATTHLVSPFIATDYNHDIIWADGYFIQWPGQVN